MSTRIEREERLVQYLLGGLTADEREEIEGRILMEDGFHENVSATADDLSAAYLNGELSADDRARFEAHFLASPRRRERMGFVRDVVSVVEEMPQPATTRVRAAGVRWALAAAAILAVVVGGLRLLPRTNEQRRVAISPSPSAVATISPGEETPPPLVREAAVHVVRLPRAPSAQAAQVTVSPQTRTVRLEVPVPAAGPPSYEAVIQTTAGATVWRADDLAPARAGEPVVVDVPAAVLAANDYRFTLAGEGVREASGTVKIVSLHFSLHVQHR